MSPLLRNVLAIILGWLIGSIVNMGIIMIGPSVIPLPETINVMDPNSLKENIHLLETKHYIMPFLAHALGTLVGAFFAYKMAAKNKIYFALAIGVLFLIGGIINCMMLGTPFLANVIDLVFAYIPFAFIGAKLAGHK